MEGERTLRRGERERGRELERTNGDLAFPLSKESCLPSVRGKERERVGGASSDRDVISSLEERGRRTLSKESCLPKDRGREGGDSPDELPTESGLRPPGGRARGSALEPCISSLPELDPRRAACACACAGLTPLGDEPLGCAELLG